MQICSHENYQTIHPWMLIPKILSIFQVAKNLYAQVFSLK